MSKRKQCKDCPPTSKREAKYPGPRCASHHRERRIQTRNSAWEKRLWQTYHLTPDQYWAIYEAQGGCCYICQRAKGNGKKKLSVDHDHACCDGPVSCGKCVRGLLCTPCNRNVLGHLRDSVKALLRAIRYLLNPPAKPFL